MTRVGTWIRAAALAAAAIVGLVGCNENCQNTCARVYDPSQCDVQIPGVDQAESRRECENACESALEKAGEMNGYDPYVRPPVEPELDNERQAAAWMDCVWSVDCDQLDPNAGGICLPTSY